MRCLSSWKAGDGNTYALAQINDFSIIPQSIISATSMTNAIVTTRSQSIPSYVTDSGDLLFDLQTSIDADVTFEFLSNDVLRILYGRYNYNDTGDRMSGDQWKDLVNSNFFKQGGWRNMSDGKIKYYLAIVIDDANERAYAISIENVYYHWGGQTGWNVYIMGGLSSSRDLLFETFGEVVLNQSSGGGGLYGGYKGGAGSGYIGNSLVSNKKMVGYNVPTSSDTATKTETINEYSETPVSGKPKAGNGYVKITFLRDA